MTKKNLSQATGLLNPAEPEVPKIILDEEESTRNSLIGSVMDNISIAARGRDYDVKRKRWLILGMFVIYSASNSMQWTQYTIIQDIIMNYYGVTGNQVSWTSIIYMITYVPLIFPASWFLDKTVSDFNIFFIVLRKLLTFHRNFWL